MAGVNLKEVDSNRIVLVVVPSRKVEEINLCILKDLLNTKKAYCVYVTMAKPYGTMLNILKKDKVETERIFFIDCVTPVITQGMQRVGNCVFCSPQALTSISIALTSALQSLPKKEERVLVLDTLSTMMLYNEAKTVTKFVHSLMAKLREWEVRSIILTLEEETDKKILAQLGTFVDKVIEVK